MSDTEREFLPKWFRGPITNSMKLNVGKTNDEVCEGIEQRIRDANASNPWARPGSREHRMSPDEEHDLGCDDMRDLFNPGNGWEWETVDQSDTLVI